ncbi:ABC transporter substrate-binding protein [Antarctobacter sp.]|uniref:ABC transporter substrate-binding protein n=1 Tax=Antarctobacter sp. TaxID=1872577 RepID=UPI003A911959
MIRTNSGTIRAAVSAMALAIGFAASAGAQEQLTVRLDFSPWGVHAGMHLAQHMGWFEEAGLNVEVQDGRGSGNTLQLVNAGRVDVGQVQLGLLGAAREEGAKVTSFAGFQRKTDLCILVDKDSEVAQIADLKGKSLVVFAASPWAAYINDFLAAGGLDEGDAEVLFVDPAALWGTYTAGRADGLMSTIGSAIPVAEASRPSKCLMLDLADLYFPSYGLIASEDTIADRGADLAKLVAVQQRAWAEIKENPQAGVEAILAMRPDAKLNPDVLRAQIQLTVDYFDTPATEGHPIGWQAEADWAQALAGMEKIGLIASGWTATDYFTNDLVE